MLSHDERAEWEESFYEAQRTPEPDHGPGWYVTACGIATGLLALWAIYTWLPAS